MKEVFLSIAKGMDIIMKKKIKKIYFIRTVCSKISDPELPLNLLILAACLENSGYKPQILDYDVIKKSKPEILNESDNSALLVAKDILSHNADCVFFTCMCSNFARTISIIKHIKQLDSSVFVGIGGPHVSMCAKDTIKAYYDVLDVVMIGEGEQTIIELMDCLNKDGDFKNVKGLCFFTDKIHFSKKRELLNNLDESPIPAYHLINVDDYNKMTGKTNVYIGSGCPFACNFCTTSLMWERRYRTKRVERVIEELKILKYKYKKGNFVFIHDNLTANRAYAILLFNAIKDANLDIQYEISSRIDTIDEELIKLFGTSGGKTIFFGVETGSARMQKVIGKNLTLNRIAEILRTCRNNGVEASTSFIIGFPEETAEDMEETIKLSFRCRTMVENQVGMNLLSIYPGSPLSKSAYNDLYLEKINYEFPMYIGLSEEEIADIKKYKNIYINYYLYKNYSNGLSSIEMRKLFDYITIVLEKYQYTFNYLINILKYFFVEIFKKQIYTIDKLTIEEKDRYNYRINIDDFINDLVEIIKEEDIPQIKEWLTYDACIDDFYQYSLKNKDQFYCKLFRFNVDIDNNCIVDDWIYYMIIGKNGELYELEINQKIYSDIQQYNGGVKKIEKYLADELDIAL